MKAILAIFGLALLFSPTAQSAPTSGTVELAIIDEASGKPVACLVFLKNSEGKPQRADGLPFFAEHFTCAGTATLKLSPDSYTYEVEKGKEYPNRKGSFTIGAGQTIELKIQLERFANMAAEGWYAADLHNHRTLDEMALLMRAEDIHIGPVTWWWSSRKEWMNQTPPEPVIRFGENYYCHPTAGEDERGPGGILYFNLKHPVIPKEATWDFPSMEQLIEEAASEPDGWIDAERPYWWEMPVWLACGRIDSIEVLNNSIQQHTVLEDEGWARHRDLKQYPPPWGNPNWSQDFYFHILNCGFRIPPSAGTASGVHPSPYGYNRVYVHVEKDLTYEKWWRAFREGRCFITNGPLLRPTVNGELPGHVFTSPVGVPLDLDIKIKLVSRDPVPALEIIKNGQIERTIPYDEWKKTGSLGTLRFQESGWFLIRAVTNIRTTYRFAMTGPYYVEIGKQGPRMSRRSIQFFLDMLQQGVERIKKGEHLMQDRTIRASEQEHFLRYYAKAMEIWQKKMERANAE